jgi:hypothetical protein
VIGSTGKLKYEMIAPHRSNRKRPANFLGFVQLAALCILLKQF